jgi:hypothetical protein
MQTNGKILALLSAGWGKLVAWAKWAWRMLDTVIDPPPKAIKWYILILLVAGIGGGLVLAPWFAPQRGPKPVYSLASPPAGIAVSFPPRVRSKDLVPLKTLKPQPPPATVKAVDASKGKKSLYRKPKCNTVLC